MKRPIVQGFGGPADLLLQGYVSYVPTPGPIDLGLGSPGGLILQGYTPLAAFHYLVYGGVPIDYGTSLVATGAHSWVTPPLSPGTHRFGVRTTYSGLIDQNLDAAVEITIDAAYRDVSSRPMPPSGLRAIPGQGGTARLEWTAPVPTRTRAPSQFRVYLGATVPDYTTPVATVAASGAFAGSYSAALSGLADGSYVVAIRAVNAGGEEPNATVIPLVIDSAAPGPVDGLAIAATGEAD